MLNNAVVVGRLHDIYDREHILLKIPSIVKNGEDTIIKIKVAEKIRENVEKKCNIGDTLGVRGIFRGIFPDDEFVAEKVTYLSRKNEKN